MSEPTLRPVNGRMNELLSKSGLESNTKHRIDGLDSMSVSPTHIIARTPIDTEFGSSRVH